MNLLSTFQKLFPENSFGGQCGSFCHKLYAADAKFPLLGSSLSSKQAELWRSGTPHPADFRVGDVVLFNYWPYGHLAVVNQIVGESLILTESNYYYNFKVHHSRQVSIYSKAILGVWRGTPLYVLPTPVVKVKLVQNTAPWPSMPAKFADIRSLLLTASNGKLDINIDVDYMNLPVPLTTQGYPGTGVDLSWYTQNVLPHKGNCDVVCLLSSPTPELGLTFGWHSGPGQLQVFADEQRTITSNTFGTLNYFVHAFIHELCHFLNEGNPDVVHQYFNDSLLPSAIFDLKGFLETIDYEQISQKLA